MNMSFSTFDDSYHKLIRFAYGAQIVLGLSIALLSRTTWVEVAWVDYRGTDDWYGRVILVAGVLIAAIGVIGLTDRLSGTKAMLSSFFGLIASICSVVITFVVGIRTRQIAADIRTKARAPERWFEDTLLEGVGRILANISESISEPVQPSLSRAWQFLLAAAFAVTLASTLVSWSLWRGSQHESDHQIPSPEIPD